MSFHQIYTPLLHTSSSNLYTTLFFQRQINSSLGIKTYDLDLFIRNCGLDETQFNDSLRELESLDLAKVYIQKNIDSEIIFTIKLEEVKSIREALRSEKISPLLRSALTGEKYSELQLLVEDIDYGYEVDLKALGGTEVSSEIPRQENILDEETYCTFYNGIFRSLNSQFSLCDDVLRMVRDYHIISNKLSMEKLQHFSCLSIREDGGKLMVSPEHLRFLVEQETQRESRTPFNEFEYDDFWRELLILSPREAQSKFNNLFSKYSSEHIYILLTDKGKIPATLNKWIVDCIRTKNLTFPILNASISFVKTLLNKVPINYLIKLTNTLHTNGVTTVHEFMDHIKKVIVHDSENQNRIGAKTQPSKPEEKKTEIYGVDEEPCFFNRKSTL